MSEASAVTIASRQLALLPSGRPVLVELDAPRRRRTGEWACAYRIRGLGRARSAQAFGQDSLEALQLALVALRRELEPFGPRLTWTGEPGELGLPLLIPDFFGGEVRRRLEGLVQRELEREGRRLKELAVPEPG
jgi:hypothetical protein